MDEARKMGVWKDGSFGRWKLEKEKKGRLWCTQRKGENGDGLIKKNSITDILWKFGFHCAILCISQSAFGKLLKVSFRLLKK